jgi:hypothetical protein
MDYINKLEKYLGNKYDNIVKISDDLHNPDLELSEWYTADDYTLHVLTNDARNIDWENDVYYYEPQFDTIIDRIEETCHDMGFGTDVKIYLDAESYLPEGEVLDWLEQKED